MTFVQSDVGLTSLDDGGGTANRGNHTTTDSSNLAATKDTVAHTAAVHHHVGVIYTTVVDIAATEDTTTIIEVVGTDTVFCSLVVDLLLIVISCLKIPVAHITVQHLDIRGTKDGTALAAAIDISLNSGDTVKEASTIGLADHDVCLGKDIIASRVTDTSFHLFAIHCLHVMAHTTFPAAAIDVTHRSAFYVGIGTRHEACAIRTGIFTSTMHIHHRTARSGCIDILLHRTTQQSHVGCTRHHSVRTQTTAVGIVRNGGTLVNNDVGRVSILNHEQVFRSEVAKVTIVHLCRSYQRISQVGVCALPIGFSL